jgi:hypothetical protein
VLTRGGGTAGDFMDFMLDEKVYERDETSKKTSRDDFTVFHGAGVDWGQGDYTQCPWEST